MSLKVIAIGAAILAGVSLAPAASAQSWGIYVGSGYPTYRQYDPYYADRRAEWLARQRWEQRERWERRERWEQHERWEHEQARRYWERERWEHRRDWRRDDDDDE